MENRQLAMKMAKILSDKKAAGITVIDIGGKSGFADYFVIATAGSLRQLDALTDELEDKLAQDEIFVDHVEGKGESGWVLLDYGDVIANLFTEEQRERYQIEKIWSDCPCIDIEEE